MAKYYIFEVKLKLQNGEVVTDVFAATNLTNCKSWIYHTYGDMVEIISYIWY